MTLLVLGIDAATWRMIDPYLDQLPNFKKLKEEAESSTLKLEEKPLSPLIWCGMFSGEYGEEHGHEEFVDDGDIVSRDDIDVDFIWDVLDEDIDIRALNVPFIVPPYNHNVEFESVGYGLPTNEDEWEEEIGKVGNKTLELLEENPDVLISVFTSLDRVQHFHWGEDEYVLKWYKKIDNKLGEILYDSGFMSDENNKLIIVSDHGFCSFGEAEVQTLPKETDHGELKGDHHEEAILVTKNLDQEVQEPQDVYRAILNTIQN